MKKKLKKTKHIIHIMKLLSKTDYYKEIPNKDDRKTMQKIKNLLERHRTTPSLTEKKENYLTDFVQREQFLRSSNDSSIK